jgi:energy-coupling factor transport system ATP-binding protein
MIHIKNLSVTYPVQSHPVLTQINVRIERNEFVLICGPSGCGKSSLMLCMNGIMHHATNAKVEGAVSLNGTDIKEYSLPNICRVAGSVFQNPAVQLCTSVVETEVAFGLENLNTPRRLMEKRISRALELTGLKEMRRHKVHELSGGQQQRLAIACALALTPQVLLLDEPTSQLDPMGAKDILEIISRLKDAGELAVVVIEHRLETPLRLADRVLIMDKGSVLRDTTPFEVLKNSKVFRSLGLHAPSLPALFEKLGRTERPVLAKDAPPVKLVDQQKNNVVPLHPKRLLSVEALQFTYPRAKASVLRNISFEIYRGDRIALMGANGAGKSTLLHLLSGTLKPDKGKIFGENGARPVTGMVWQNPDVMLFSETVEQELTFAPLQRGEHGEALELRMENVLSRFSLASLKHRAPFTLSRGERQRTAVGSVMTLDAPLVLLDEPTTGQDRARIKKMMDAIVSHSNAIVFSTHDIEMASHFANRIILLCGAYISAMGPPDEVLKQVDVLAHSGVCLTQLQQFSVANGLRFFHIDEMVEGAG